MSSDLGASGACVAAFLAFWFFVSILNQLALLDQLSDRLGKWIKGINGFALIPSWTFFAPTPGTSDYRFVVRDVSGDVYGDWEEINWCGRRCLSDAVWNPRRHRVKLIVDCVDALSKTVKELKEHGFNVETEPGKWMISVPYMALLNIAVSMPRTSKDITARQFAIVEQQPGSPSQVPRLRVCSARHDLL